MEKTVISLIKYPLIAFVMGMALVLIGAFLKIIGIYISFLLYVGILVEGFAMLWIVSILLHRKLKG